MSRGGGGIHHSSWYSSTSLAFNYPICSVLSSEFSTFPLSLSRQGEYPLPNPLLLPSIIVGIHPPPKGLVLLRVLGIEELGQVPFRQRRPRRLLLLRPLDLLDLLVRSRGGFRCSFTGLLGSRSRRNACDLGDQGAPARLVAFGEGGVGIQVG
jgi:hypothetical protein